MNKKIYGGTGLILLAVAFLVFTLFNNMLFSGAKLDLTEGNLYTLSDGTRKIINSIDEPINLYFFFSDKTSQNLTGLRAYSQRVKELLEQTRASAMARSSSTSSTRSPSPMRKTKPPHSACRASLLVTATAYFSALPEPMQSMTNRSFPSSSRIRNGSWNTTSAG